MCTPTLPETLTQLSAANQLPLLVAYCHHLLPTCMALASFYEVFAWCLHLLPLASCRPGRLPLPLPPQMSSASGNERTRARTGELVILEFCSPDHWQLRNKKHFYRGDAALGRIEAPALTIGSSATRSTNSLGLRNQGA